MQNLQGRQEAEAVPDLVKKMNNGGRREAGKFLRGWY
jgi:hypothetical protein